MKGRQATRSAINLLCSVSLRAASSQEQPRTLRAGFGGNLDTSYIFPTATSVPAKHGEHALSCFITGPSAEQRTSRYDVVHPLRRRTVVNWAEYEKLMFGCLCECATCLPL